MIWRCTAAGIAFCFLAGSAQGAGLLRMGAQAPAAQSSASTQKTDAPQHVSDREAWDHRAGGRRIIRTPDAKKSFPYYVLLELEVGTEGTVISARATYGPQEFFAEAIRLAKSWKFKPFERNGRPVVARLRDWVHIYPPERHPETRVPFPEVKDWDSLRITLDRTGCYGVCSDYRVEIHGDGTVLYEGRGNVGVIGKHRDRISREALLELVGYFRDADYFSLFDRYEAMITDSPSTTTSLAYDQFRKSVYDYVGGQAGMPDAVWELEWAIDRLAGTMKWWAGNANTVPSLKAEGWDFKAQDAAHASMLVSVAQFGNAQAVRDLIAAGVPADSRDPTWKISALSPAARRGEVEMLRTLLDAGAGKANKEDRSAALSVAAAEGNVEIVRLLLSSGADPSYRDETGKTALMNATLAGIYLESIRMNKMLGEEEDRPGEARREIVHMLLRAGADVNAQNKTGNTALMETLGPDLTRILLEAGADPSAKNTKGQTALDLARLQDSKEKAAVLEKWLAEKANSAPRKP